MTDKKKKFYITTALPYVNYAPHAGFALEIVQADVVARYHRLLGEDTFFLTGTDENSLKNVQAAKEEGIPVKKLVDRNAKEFYKLKKILNLSFDDFIRTTEQRHIKGAQKLWKACQKDIYKKPYRGLYCLGCEEFYKESELVNGLCPEHKTKAELVEEENYFFKLSKYQNQLKKIIEKDKVKIIPKTCKNEVLSFINSGLEDICISREAKRGRGWGIPVPGDPVQIQWTWFDALSNYINALGYAENSKKFQEWWQKNENKLHVIGKGILRFHGVYWCAMLLSAKLALPKTIFVHGYLTSEGQKMSKSLGNVIDPFELVKKYGTDPVRYFLLRETPPTEDGDFTYEKFEQRYNSDLANGIGNLLRRVLTMVDKKLNGIIPKISNPPNKLSLILNDYKEFLDRFHFNEAVSRTLEVVKFIDVNIDKLRIYEKLPEEAAKDLYVFLEMLRIKAWMLLPFMPETSNEIFRQLGLNPGKETKKKFEEAIKWGGLKPGTKIKKGEPLFPRI